MRRIERGDEIRKMGEEEKKGMGEKIGKTIRSK